MTSGKKRAVLVQVTGLEPAPAEGRKLRVQVTLYGLSAAVVEKLAELSPGSRSQVVRELVAEAVSRRRVYDAVE